MNAIRGKNKSTGQLEYFLSHAGTVIVGNNEGTLADKLGEIDGELVKIPEDASSSNQLVSTNTANHLASSVAEGMRVKVISDNVEIGKLSGVKIGAGLTIQPIPGEPIPIEHDLYNLKIDSDYFDKYLAEFKGTVNTVAALKALTGNDNDWAILRKENSGKVTFERYRYNGNYDGATSDPTHGDTGHWMYEIDFDNSSFTDAQWNAINSGITSNILLDLLGRRDVMLCNVGSTTLSEIQDVFDEGQPRKYIVAWDDDNEALLQMSGYSLDGNGNVEEVVFSYAGIGNGVAGIMTQTLDVSGWNYNGVDMQSKLSQTQMNAVNSGITASWMAGMQGNFCELTNYMTSGDALPIAKVYNIDGFPAEAKFRIEVLPNMSLAPRIYFHSPFNGLYIKYTSDLHFIEYYDGTTGHEITDSIKDIFDWDRRVTELESDLGGYYFDTVDVSNIVNVNF